MRRRNRWIWFVLFVWVAILLGSLATGWNVLLIQNYYKMLELARRFTYKEDLPAPWFMLVFGTLGFVTALALVIIFFLRLLKEMKLNQLQSEFLAAVSHELKTPIAALELTSSLIRAGDVTPEETQSLWEAHAKELKRLRDEVDTLLEAAHWQIHPPAVERRNRVKLEPWLSEALDRWKRLLGPGATLEREGPLLDVEALVDLKTFNLIADNLLDNARKFSRGAPSVLVRTHLISPKSGSRPTRWWIQVQDRGWGFSPTDSKRIFWRFFRARSGAPHAIPGTGLGLYLARSASQALGLKLRGESPGPGLGATFTLEGRIAPSEETRGPGR